MVIHLLLNGIVSKWAATSALTSLFTINGTDGPFAEEAPSGTNTYPFCVMEVPAGQVPLIDAYGNAISAETVVIFKVIGRGRAATALNMATLCGVFDHATLTLSGATNIGMYRIGEPIPVKLGDDPTGDIWQWAVSYNYQVQ